ncbi:MAG: DnaJ domain-containing protein [bacterium]
MSDTIRQYLDSGKKIKIRVEKLLVTLHLSKFSGTVTVFTESETFPIVVADGKFYCEKSVIHLSSLDQSALFSLESTFPENYRGQFREYSPFDLIYRIVENIDFAHIVAMIKPIATEHFSIRPEAVSLSFLHKELEPFVGQKRIEILTNFRKHHRIIFFLLLTRFASVVKSTEEERKQIAEVLNRTNMFDIKATEEEEEENLSEDQKLTNFLDVAERYKDIYHLFGVSFDFNDKVLHNSYLRIVQKIHPDTLSDVTKINRERAEKFFKIVSENYELLRDPEERELAEKLTRRYGAIKSRLDFVRMKEYDEAIFKGRTLLTVGNYHGAAEIFGLIYEQTKNPDALEKRILALWKMAPKWSDFEKTIKYPELKEEILKLTTIQDPDIEILFILAEIYEFQKLIPDCMKILTLITKIQPDNFKAQGMKKRIMYYESLEKKGKI